MNIEQLFLPPCYFCACMTERLADRLIPEDERYMCPDHRVVFVQRSVFVRKSSPFGPERRGDEWITHKTRYPLGRPLHSAKAIIKNLEYKFPSDVHDFWYSSYQRIR